jgi:hemoglobin
MANATSFAAVPLPSDDELHAIARAFYDKVYAHPWIGQYFAGVDQARQELKLVRFFHLAWNDVIYAQLQGQYLKEEHAHMVIPPALFDLRQALMAEAMRELGHDEALVHAVLAFNEVWRPYVVKASRQECTKAFGGHAILDIPPPK